uniref:Testis, prostate and placenta expressed n=1 Tax=Latimeria chalumnae TaxID=7897 RepID=M3XKH3_LATCH|nr:PREDICTED: testis, prostate and placenta-expressed protein [Latimeria chalumnae]XP_014354366.1 PREDICTED: testis, prostate and placenta-expressed protein [Latimeria chalumnae]XP_014354367.1 PREDICTED: testis, prostate and placenta-expressed protein [Latimeria chalumnae]|eukprot:XP_006013001.1 PREDICTED: testis, prostate and placenta-expressed protein [Latimeria chalumnae]
MQVLPPTIIRGPVQWETKKYSLVAVKDSLYHPELPTLRRMEMDNMVTRLPDEHCRSTTYCGPERFKNSSMTLFEGPERRLCCYGTTDTGREHSAKYRLGAVSVLPPRIGMGYLPPPTKPGPDWTKIALEAWIYPLPNWKSRELHFYNYATRFLKPKFTQSWKYGQRHPLDKLGQKLYPNSSSRYSYMMPW